jgi:hypothetical protein
VCLGLELGTEEWTIRSVGRDLFLVGGRPRGTLYAVYLLARVRFARLSLDRATIRRTPR